MEDAQGSVDLQRRLAGLERSVRRSQLLNLVVVGLLLACAAPARRGDKLKLSELEVERLVVVDSSGTPCAVFGPHERAAGRVALAMLDPRDEKHDLAILDYYGLTTTLRFDNGEYRLHAGATGLICDVSEGADSPVERTTVAPLGVSITAPERYASLDAWSVRSGVWAGSEASPSLRPLWSLGDWADRGTSPERRPPAALRFYDDSWKEIATFPPR